jgi:Tfp pilus assembly protein PilF
VFRSWWPLPRGRARRDGVGRIIRRRRASPLASARGSVVELTELVRGAQEAMDRGNYHLAASACSHALESFPDCMSAHRILGEALLERGETEPAIGHFERALALDPLSVVARLGLGVAAEERKDPGLAYAHYLHAWEINPALDQVRGQLVRLRAQLGSHDRLHPTRAGLAGIHARSGQLGRAAAEWRAILAVDPESVRARTSLAEVLWRAGDDAGAAATCREILKTAPDNARALAILADIDKRVGAPSANDWVNRYQTIDPMGEVVQVIGELREGADLSFLTPAGPAVPDFDFEAVAAESPAQSALAAAAPAAPSLAASHMAAPDLWDNLVRDLEHDATDAAEPDAESIQPFSWSDDGSVIDLGPAVEPFSLDGLQDLDEFGADVADPLTAAIASAVPEFDLPVMETEPAVVAVPVSSSIGTNELAAMLEPEPAVATPPAPLPRREPIVAAPAVAPSPVATAPNPFVTSDGRVDLTIGWDEIDRALQAATPSEGNAAGYEDLFAELDAGGLAPFAADDGAANNGAWEPFSADEFDVPPPVVTDLPPVPVPALADEVVDVVPAAMPWGLGDELAAVPDDWVDIDEDLIASIPSAQPSGYTDLLRHVDNDAFAAVEEIAAIDLDPFANPDSSGDPLGIEDLLTVTSRDGTAELGPVAPHPAPSFMESNEAVDLFADDVDLGAGAFAWPDEGVAAAFDDGSLGVGDELAEIAPFNFDELVAGGAPAAMDDFSDLEDVFAPIPFAIEAPAQPEVASSAHEAGSAPADVPAFDWAGAIGEVETPVAAQMALAGDSVEVDDDIRWPTFVSHTSDLIDRESAGLFDRLRAAKHALVAEGRLVVAGSLVPRAPVGPTPLAKVDEAVHEVIARPRLAAIDGEPVPAPRAEANGFDLTAMRVRLIESESAAAEIASTLEAAVAQGDTDPLALRVLGEAYLRLGRTEQAAAQFRQAMLARRRVR